MQSLKSDQQFMRRAIALASKGSLAVSPNPMVGAVIVRNGKIVSEGWHRKFGGPHAEAEVLNLAQKKGKKVSGCDLYVNLEPCSHKNKKTPPCVPLIIKSGIKRVIVAMKDPNPFVCGKGIAALKKAKIKVDLECLIEEAMLLNEKYIKWITKKTPFVGMKVAMSLDGKIATRTGDSKWITSEKSRRFVKKLRDSYDAIFVGVGTVIKDNPRLAGLKTEPLRIILDSTLRSSLKSKVFRDSNVLVATTKRAGPSKIRLFQKRGIALKIFPEKIKLTSLLRFLAKRNIASVFIEGGAEIFGSFIDQKLVDKIYWFIAPKIIGGKNAKSAIAGNGFSKIKEVLNVYDLKFQTSGGDFFFQGKLSSKRSTHFKSLHIPK